MICTSLLLFFMYYSQVDNTNTGKKKLDDDVFNIKVLGRHQEARLIEVCVKVSIKQTRTL